jgi:hypothetical protein
VRRFAALLVLVGCGRAPSSSDAAAGNTTLAHATDAGPEAEAALEVPTVSYTRTSFDGLGVSVDVPSILTERRGAVSDTTFSSSTAKMTLFATGTCRWKMNHFCRPLDPSEKGFARKSTESSCFETGTKGERIVWRRRRIEDGVLYFLELEYPATERIAFDPIVEHVSRSWVVPTKEVGGHYCSPGEIIAAEAAQAVP